MPRRNRRHESADHVSLINVRIVSFQPRENVPQNLHQIQGVNHLNKVLNYAPFVTENGKATVYLTAEDWHVVADTLFHMESPDGVLPEAIQSFKRKEGEQVIELTTADAVIDVEVV
jgi:hypothetical protein